jgi:flagellar hook-associated protein FlgK
MSVITTALSGINAAETRLSTAANNIANVTTPGFKPQDVAQTPLTGGGVRADVIERSPASVAFENTQGRQDLPNISLDEELVQANLASYDVQANIRVLKTQKELDKALLDIQA